MKEVLLGLERESISMEVSSNINMNGLNESSPDQMDSIPPDSGVCLYILILLSLSIIIIYGRTANAILQGTSTQTAFILANPSIDISNIISGLTIQG